MGRVVELGTLHSSPIIMSRGGPRIHRFVATKVKLVLYANQRLIVKRRQAAATAPAASVA